MKVLTVGLTFSGKVPAGVEIENLGLCRSKVNEKRSAYPLYEYDVIVINPESYSHFLFGKEGKFSKSKRELSELKHSKNEYDLDAAFDYSDRANEMVAALKKGTVVVWCLTSDERVNFFGYRTRHIAYLNDAVERVVKKSGLMLKKGRSLTVLDRDSPFASYFDVLSRAGWRECLTDPPSSFTSIANTPEGYSIGGDVDLGGYKGWIMTSPRTQEAANQLVLSAISIPSGAVPRRHYHSVFLSHTSADKPFVRRLRTDLLDRGVPKVWIDEAEIEVGDSLIAKIEEGMKETNYIGVVLSKSSVNAPWVKKELDVAMNREIAGGEPIVLPLLYQRCEIPSFLTGKLYADFTTPEAYETSLEKLLRRLRIR
ncbi:toll/interleukin-1 receptor domain-containing protein [Bradyrhizobium sp. SZCCHNS2096]|uniref:toll/interleukin-1 receptor domain-containing protein n=1 Tax=Bradyrhizobium sp. SZCCHNS2096 TaxID=3057309 RepID=UPI0029170CD3|nr:toll/interleukin-1 receptor domain-containing protein [Bradyrhizobium sp. SZCCHNS2096]